MSSPNVRKVTLQLLTQAGITPHTMMLMSKPVSHSYENLKTCSAAKSSYQTGKFLLSSLHCDNDYACLSHQYLYLDDA